jgi:quinoprotein glucose dehydrogenase
MPSFRMDPNDLQSLVAFIRSGFDADASALAGPPGDTARGQGLFEGKAACLSCHRVNDKGQDSAPDLTEIGRGRTAVALQRTLIDPTGSMLPINRPVRAVRRDGSVVKGRRLNEDTYTVQIMSEQGRLVPLVKADLREWSVGTTSSMPSYKDTLTPGEMTDLVSYLVSLKGSQR